MLGKGKDRITTSIVFALVTLFVVVFLFMFLADNPDFLDNFVKTYGLLGLFIGSIIANATIVLPIPFDILILLIGANPIFIGIAGSNIVIPLIVGIIAGIGSAIGEMTAYILGLMGVKSAEKLKQREFANIERARKKIRDWGMLFIFLGAFTPFPFDIVGIAAGLLKYNLYKFFAATLAGKLLRCVLIAYAGFFGIEIIKQFYLLA